MKKLLSLIVLLGTMIICSGQTTNFTFVNKSVTMDPEIPNYGRGAQYWNGTSWDGSQAPQVPPGTPTTGAKTLYWRYWWSDHEVGQGGYRFTKASMGNDFWKSPEWHLEWCANNGALYSLGGIMTSWDGQGTIFYDGGWSVYPQYLHNLMQAEPVYKDWKYNAQNCWVPNWNSQAYLDRWRVINDTLLKYIKNWKYTPTSGPWAGKLVEGSKIIDFVDLRGFGNYGEWHTYPWGDDGSEPSYGKATDSTFKKIIDIGADVWGDYPLMIPVGVFDDNPWGEGTAFSAYWAMTKNTRYGVISWRRDNIGDPGLDNFLVGNTFTYNGWRADTAILARWKYGMINGEPLNGTTPCCPYFYDVRREIGLYHYAGFGNGNYGNNSQRTWDTINAVFKLTGYRLNLNGGNMTTTLNPDGQFFIKMNWRNIGSSPMYMKRWKVKYQLRNSADAEVQTWTSKFNPYLFLPSSTDSVVIDTFKLNTDVPLGSTYKLVIYIQDTLGLAAPLNFPLTTPSRNTDGTYTIRTGITVGSALPAYFQTYYANNMFNRVDVSWKVSCNPSASYYVVQKSTDGVIFSNLATVPADEMSCVSLSYLYSDYLWTPGNSFYRVVRYDVNGSATYTPIMKVVMPTNDAVIIYPKPTTGVFNVVLTSAYRGNVKITISNLAGQLMRTYSYNKAGGTLSVALNMSGFTAGTYIISTYQGSTLYNSQSQVKN